MRVHQAGGKTGTDKGAVVSELMLKKRLKRVAKTQPEVWDLREILLGLGGTELVVMPPQEGFDIWIPLLVKKGSVMAFPVEFRRMIESNCHGNVETLCHRRKELTGIGTGYALSDDDGLWRWHSWGILNNPARIVETTSFRVRYYGLQFPTEFRNFCGRLAEERQYLEFTSRTSMPRMTGVRYV